MNNKQCFLLFILLTVLLITGCEEEVDEDIIIGEWTISSFEEYENMNCKITGYIIAEYFYSHKFVFNVTDIELETDDTKLKRLKEHCKANDYFANKKNIYWNNSFNGI